MGKSVLNIGGFSIVRRLGTGARSIIYLAVDESTKSQVALKRVIFERPEDSRIFEQVETEYKVATKVDHPYVRQCYKLHKIRGLFKTKEMLLSMEFFDAPSLEEGPALSLVDVLLVFRMVANGLHGMHQNGFVHCDIKPNNILFSKGGNLKIIDLGQSCRIGTVKQRIQGTPDYIAPEQVKRKPLNPKTDIFNLGATMYWALTGHNVPTLIPKNKDEGLTEPKKAIPPHVIKKQIPVALSELVMDCVREDASDRPQNMTALISRLDVMIHNILGDKIKASKNASTNHSTAATRSENQQ